jgi:AcrR family transcriptional regulator
MVMSTGTPAGRRRRADPGQGAALRELILSSADGLLAERGDESALTLRAVALRAGVTTPSVYLHFRDKDALVGAVCLRVWGELERVMRAAETSTEDPFQALRRCGAAYVHFAVAHPHQYRLLMMRRPRTDPSSPETLAARACLDHLVSASRLCTEAGVLLGDPEQLALRMWSAVHGCAALVISHPDLPWPADLDQLAHDVSRMAGLGTAVLTRLTADGRTWPGATFAAAFDELPERLAELAISDHRAGT